MKKKTYQLVAVDGGYVFKPKEGGKQSSKFKCKMDGANILMNLMNKPPKDGSLTAKNFLNLFIKLKKHGALPIFEEKEKNNNTALVEGFFRAVDGFINKLELYAIAEKVNKTGLPCLVICKICGKHAYIFAKGKFIDNIKTRNSALKHVAELHKNRFIDDKDAIRLSNSANKCILPENEPKHEEKLSLRGFLMGFSAHGFELSTIEIESMEF